MPDESDLTELTKHLRTVHFTLLVACILFFLSTRAERRSEVNTAHLQLQKIVNIRNSWDRWTQKFSFEQLDWLRKQDVQWLEPGPEPFYIDSATLIKKGIRSSPGTSIVVRLIGAPIYFYLGKNITIAIPYGKLNVSDVFPLEISFPGNSSGSKEFKSLKEFINFWNSSYIPRVNFIKKIDSYAYVIIDNNIQNKYKLNEKSNNKAIPNWTRGEFKSIIFNECPEVDFQVINQSVGHKKFNEFYCTKLENGGIVIPAEVRNPRLPTNLHQWLIKEFNLEGGGGDFSDMFPELDRVTNHFQELDTHKINKILSAELARQGERIQFLGMSFPEQLIISWGALIVFAIQIYFWLHLRAFSNATLSNMGDALRYTGWIGIYNDSWAIAISVLTASIFPMLVVAYTVYDSLWWLSILLSFLILALSIDSVRLLYKINYNYFESNYKRYWDWIAKSIPILRRRQD